MFDNDDLDSDLGQNLEEDLNNNEMKDIQQLMEKYDLDMSTFFNYLETKS